MSSTNLRCSSGIISTSFFPLSPPSSTPTYVAGTSTSTPYGRSPSSFSIQSSSTSSCSGVKATAPSTPMPPAFDTAATTSRQWLKARIGNSMPRRSQTGVRMPRFCASGGVEGEFQDLVDLVDEVEGHVLAHLLGYVVEVGLVTSRENDLLQPGSV